MEYSEELISELKSLTNTAKIKDLSMALDVSPVTVRGWRTRGIIPDHIITQARQISQKNSPKGYLELPFYDVEVSAGNGSLVEREDKTDEIIFSHRFITDSLGVNPKNIFLMPVKGDSMTPTLKSQSIIMVNRVEQLAEDGIYVFRYDGQLRVKRLQFSKHGISVVSDNSAYKTWELDKSELATEDFEIIGEVIWSGQRM